MIVNGMCFQSSFFFFSNKNCFLSRLNIIKMDNDIDTMFDNLLNDPELEEMLKNLEQPTAKTSSNIPNDPSKTSSTPTTTNVAQTQAIMTATPSATEPPKQATQPPTPKFAAPESFNFDFLDDMENSILDLKGQIDGELDRLQSSLDLLKHESIGSAPPPSSSTKQARKIEESSETFDELPPPRVENLPPKPTTNDNSNINKEVNATTDIKPEKRLLKPLNTSALDELELLVSQRLPQSKPQPPSQFKPQPPAQPKPQPVPQPPSTPAPLIVLGVPKPQVAQPEPLDLAGKSDS